MLMSQQQQKLEKELGVCEYNNTDNVLVACLRCSSDDQSALHNRINCLCALLNPRITNYHHHHHHLGLASIDGSMRFEHPGQIYSYIKNCRKWIKVWNPSNVTPKGEFSLTTYNILSQNLLLNHLYLYQGKEKSDLMWSERGERLKQELLEMNSDIFCLQEVHLENFQHTILPYLLDRGYQAVFKRKTGTALDGCSILFKKNKFRLQDSLEVEFNQSNISHLLDKDNVALMVKLLPINLRKETDTSLIVATTHLLFNPKRGDIKLAQLRLLLAEIQRFALKEKISSSNPYHMNYFPVILCGDMNSEPNSPLINFIEHGKQNLYGYKSGDISGQREGIERGRYMQAEDLQLKGIDHHSCFEEIPSKKSTETSIDGQLTIQHVFNFRSVYPIMDEHSRKLVSMSTYYDSGLVDHIFYSYKHKNLRLFAFRQLLNRRNLSSIGHLPNTILGSDHIALSAKFYLL